MTQNETQVQAPPKRRGRPPKKTVSAEEAALEKTASKSRTPRETTPEPSKPEQAREPEAAPEPENVPVALQQVKPITVSAARTESAPRDLNPAATELLKGGECGDCCGILDIRPDPVIHVAQP